MLISASGSPKSINTMYIQVLTLLNLERQRYAQISIERNPFNSENAVIAAKTVPTLFYESNPELNEASRRTRRERVQWWLSEFKGTFSSMKGANWL